MWSTKSATSMELYIIIFFQSPKAIWSLDKWLYFVWCNFDKMCDFSCVVAFNFLVCDHHYRLLKPVSRDYIYQKLIRLSKHNACENAELSHASDLFRIHAVSIHIVATINIAYIKPCTRTLFAETWTGQRFFLGGMQLTDYIESGFLPSDNPITRPLLFCATAVHFIT